MRRTAAGGSVVSVRLLHPAGSPTRARRLAEAARRAVRLALRERSGREPVEVSVVLADDGTVRALNCAYRGKDRTTDVLAFPQDGRGGLLGDVVISLDQAARQARRVRHPLLHELALLAIHGTLHLLGYEDETEGGRRAMWEVQSRLLREWTRRKGGKR